MAEAPPRIVVLIDATEDLWTCNQWDTGGMWTSEEWCRELSIGAPTHRCGAINPLSAESCRRCLSRRDSHLGVAPYRLWNWRRAGSGQPWLRLLPRRPVIPRWLTSAATLGVLALVVLLYVGRNG